MTVIKYEQMNINELRQYVLAHREDVEAFQAYIDRSKAEKRMISLDLTDNQWEEKVKEAISYSSTAIRWYYQKSVPDNVELQNINEWWKQLDRELVTKYHLTAIEIDRSTGIWEPTQVSSPVQVMLHEPSLEVSEFTGMIKYKNQDGVLTEIEAVAIDLDLEKQKIFVWPTVSNEVFIFEKVKQETSFD